MHRSARSLFVWSVLVLAACGSPSGPGDDAGMSTMVDANVPRDAGPLVPTWHSGPDYPTPIAFGTAMVLPGGDGSAYLYVFGGGSGTFGGLGPFHSEVRRSQIQSDGSLGPWQDAGNVGTGTANYALAGHGSIRVVAEDGAIGVAIAGGGGPSGMLGQVLAGYVQTVDGSFGMWGAFAPLVSATQGGHVHGSFNTFEAHQLALVGGMQGTTPIDHVIIAATMAGTMVPTWRDGPPLPAPRFGHGSAQIGSGTPDIYLIGGMGVGGALMGDILLAQRDSTSLEVTSWVSAGTLTSPVVFPQVATLDSHVYVMGGVAGDPGLDPLVTRVRMASAPAMGTARPTLMFAPVPGADLPDGRAGGLVAVLGHTVYIVGGMMGTDHMASASVIYCQLEP